MSRLVNLPIIKLSQTAFFPNTVLPIYISNPKLVSLVKKISKESGLIILRMEESLSFQNHNDICTAGTPIIIEELENGDIKVAVHGKHRIKIFNILQDLPYELAQCMAIPDIDESSLFNDSQVNDLRELLTRWLNFYVRDSSEREIFSNNLKNIKQYIDYISMFLIKDLETKQILLGTTSLNERIKVLTLLLKHNLQENLENGEPLSFKEDPLSMDIIKEFYELDRNINVKQ